MYLLYLHLIGVACVYGVNLRIEYGSGDKINCQNVPRKIVISRNRRDTATFNDPMYVSQWYLTNGSMNIKKAWEAGYNGTGVVISVVDTGLEKSHDEFKHRYDPAASYNFVSNTTDPTPDYIGSSKHGTNVAGIAAGEANNGKCGVGVAYGARVGGIKFIDTSGGDVSQGKDYSQNAALAFNRNYIDIYTCAWGPDDMVGATVGYNLASKTMADGTKHGRNGKGSLFVFGAGNEGLFGDMCSYDGYITSIHTLAFSVVNPDGAASNISERCPAIIAVTQARDGSQGVDYKDYPMATSELDNKCSDTFSATSAAAAVASGVLALVLQENGNLTWRDIQHIIAQSSINDPSKVIDAVNGWKTNGAGFKVSDRYGFGLLDAMAMINVAKKWKTVPEQISCSYANPIHRVIPSTGNLQDSITFDPKTCGIVKLEHVVLVLNLTFGTRGDLQVELTSPSSLVSYMLLPRFFDKGKDIKMFSTMSMHYWGEDPNGSWNVLFKNGNQKRLTSGTLKYYKLIFYGTGDNSGKNGTIAIQPTSSPTKSPVTESITTKDASATKATTTKDTPGRAAALFEGASLLGMTFAMVICTFVVR